MENDKSTIKPASLSDLLRQYEFVPQAIIEEPVFSLAKRLHTNIESGVDDFDKYEGVGAWIYEIPFAVMRYDGDPRDTSTMYLPFEVSDIEKISLLICRIQQKLDIPNRSLVWQRQDETSRIAGLVSSSRILARPVRRVLSALSRLMHFTKVR
jgi:hypothetical protein